jgi:hypothetical protein
VPFRHNYSDGDSKTCQPSAASAGAHAMLSPHAAT